MQKYIQAISWNLLFLFLFLCLLATCKSLVNLIKHKNGTMNIQHRYYNCILLLLICLRSADIYSMDIKQNINSASIYESAGYDMGKITGILV